MTIPIAEVPVNEEPVLEDIAGRGAATQSSLSRWSLPTGASAAVDGDFSRDFTIHTAETDEEPWWRLDLQAWYPVDRIILRNRRKSRYWARAKSVRVEGSDDNENWVTLHSGTVSFGASDDDALVIPLAGRIPLRYIHISLDETAVLHLNRIEVLVRSEVLRDRDLMDSIGIDFSHLTRFSTGQKKAESYSVLHAGPAPAVDAPVRGLKVVRAGRFANNVFQMAQAIQIAQRSNLDFVQMLDSPLFDFSREVEHEGLAILPADAPLAGASPVVVGDFFFTSRLGRALGRRRKTIFARENVETVRSHLRPYLRVPDLPLLADDELVLHVRSGDLFGAKPHSGYGQPPVAFYTQAIEQARLNGFARVRVVAEDRLNPVVDALEAYLTSVELPFTMQVGGDLASDVATLLAARGLVFGVGTFGHAISMLSARIEVVFEASRGDRYRTLFPELEIYSFQISKERYSPFLHWTRSPEQLREMVEYPSDLIRVARWPGTIPSRV